MTGVPTAKNRSSAPWSRSWCSRRTRGWTSAPPGRRSVTTSTASTTSGGGTRRSARSARSSSRPPMPRPGRLPHEQQQKEPDPRARLHPYWHPPRRSGWSSPEPCLPRRRTDPTGCRRPELPHPDGHEAKNLGGKGQSPSSPAGEAEQAYSTNWSGKPGQGQSAIPCPRRTYRRRSSTCSTTMASIDRRSRTRQREDRGRQNRY